MASDFSRLMREALENVDRVTNPVNAPNRTFIEIPRAKDLVIMLEQTTGVLDTYNHPPQWGATTNGPDGGNWQWNLAFWG